MRVSIIVAMARNRAIGRGNRLPWRCPADLRRFKALTMGHHLVMGRRTWDSIGRPLPGRTILVLSRAPLDLPAGAARVASLEEALRAAAGDPEVFIAGGAEIYRLALGRADRLYVTRIDADIEGDAFFPDLDPAGWRLVERAGEAPVEDPPTRAEFLVFDREPPAEGGFE